MFPLVVFLGNFSDMDSGQNQNYICIAKYQRCTDALYDDEALLRYVAATAVLPTGVKQAAMLMPQSSKSSTKATRAGK